jgi:hypothetical protein
LTNKDVVLAWKNNRQAKAKHLKTDGVILYSYHLMIGYTRVYKTVIDYTATGGEFQSKTTSRHVNLAKRYCGEIVKIDRNK